MAVTGGPGRRRFIKRAGIATGGLAAGAVALGELAPLIAPARIRIDANGSFWARELPSVSAPLRASMQTDIAVIGGGLTGLSTAYYLRKRLPGSQVILLEALRCGNGASARNGAMLLPSTADRYMQPSGDPSMDRRIHELTVDNAGRLLRLQRETGVDAEIQATGALQVYRSDRQARLAAETGSRLRDAGIAVQFWGRDQTAAAIGTHAFAGALFDPAAGRLHPGKLVAMWKRAALDAGVLIYEDTAVTHIEEAAVHVVTTSAGPVVRAPVLVIATNAYSAQLNCLRHAAAMVWDYAAVTAALTQGQLAGLGWSSRTPFNDDHIETWYLGLTGDDRVLIGGGPVDYRFGVGGAVPPGLQVERHHALHAELLRLYPSLGGIEFETAWLGAVDMSLDASPAVGRSGAHGNVYYGIGYSGHGVNLSSVFGRILADLIAGHDERWQWFPYVNRRPPFLPGEPLRWLGIQAGLATIRGFDL